MSALPASPSQLSYDEYTVSGRGDGEGEDTPVGTSREIGSVK